MRTFVQVYIQHRSLAEHRVAHALPDGQRAVAVVLAQIPLPAKAARAEK